MSAFTAPLTTFIIMEETQIPIKKPMVKATVLEPGSGPKIYESNSESGSSFLCDIQLFTYSAMPPVAAPTVNVTKVKTQTTKLFDMIAVHPLALNSSMTRLPLSK